MESDKAPRGARKPPASAWKPGQSGNPAGRKTGSRNKATLLAQALIDGNGDDLVQKAIELALDGDVPMLRVLIERLVPPRKDGPIKMKMPNIESAADLPGVTGAILAAAADGRLTPSEAQSLTALVEIHRKALELAEIEARLSKLEAKEMER